MSAVEGYFDELALLDMGLFPDIIWDRNLRKSFPFTRDMSASSPQLSVI